MFKVEDGTGLSDANSMVSVLEFKSYCDDRGIDYTGFADDTAIENALVLGADYLSVVYSENWKGELLVDTQSMPFPRVIDGEDVGIPNNIKYSQIVLALETPNGALMTDTAQRVIEEQVSSIKVKYSEFSDEMTHYTKSYNYLKPYLINASQNSYQAVR